MFDEKLRLDSISANDFLNRWTCDERLRVSREEFFHAKMNFERQKRTFVAPKVLTHVGAFEQVVVLFLYKVSQNLLLKKIVTHSP